MNLYNLFEGVHDANLFKAVWVIGGPGSGKSTIGRQLLTPYHFQHIDADRFFEFLLNKHNLTLDDIDYDDPVYEPHYSRSVILRQSIINRVVDERLPIWFDTIGASRHTITTHFEQLVKIGYDSLCIHIVTDVETALQRNEQRPRSIKPEVVFNAHSMVNDNVGYFKGMFGANYIEINSEEPITREIAKQIRKFVMTPPNNPEANKWLYRN